MCVFLIQVWICTPKNGVNPVKCGTWWLLCLNSSSNNSYSTVVVAAAAAAITTTRNSLHVKEKSFLLLQMQPLTCEVNSGKQRIISHYQCWDLQLVHWWMCLLTHIFACLLCPCWKRFTHKPGWSWQQRWDIFQDRTITACSQRTNSLFCGRFTSSAENSEKGKMFVMTTATCSTAGFIMQLIIEPFRLRNHSPAAGEENSPCTVLISVLMAIHVQCMHSLQSWLPYMYSTCAEQFLGWLLYNYVYSTHAHLSLAYTLCYNYVYST